MSFISYNNKRLYYEEMGTDHNEVVIIVPGFSVSSKAYRRQLLFLSKSYHTVSFDFLGTGNSDERDSSTPFLWKEGAQQILAIMSSLSINEVVLVGSGDGASMALTMASLYPKQIRAVVADSVDLAEPHYWKHIAQSVRDPSGEDIALWMFCHGSKWESTLQNYVHLFDSPTASSKSWVEQLEQPVLQPILFTEGWGNQKGRLNEAYLNGSLIHFPINNVLIEKDAYQPLIWTRPFYFVDQTEAFLLKVKNEAISLHD
jgi:pimeloyl-ACP methyl ester carboxylesterase